MAENTQVQPKNEQINIKVRDTEGNEVQFKIKRTTPLKKMMDTYCGRMGVETGSYRFLFDGHRLVDNDTPKGLDMQELDVVDAMVTQLGGIVGTPHDEDLDAGYHDLENKEEILSTLWFVCDPTDE